MQLSLIKGIYTTEASDLRTRYPRNMVPVVKDSGVNNYYLRPTDGIIDTGQDGNGPDRGSINWNGTLYRCMGNKLQSVSVSGVATNIGTIGGSVSKVSMDYSFTHLAIVADGNLFLYDGTTFGQNTDPDLGYVLDVIYVDGYFMLTDGEYLIVTELGDPYSVNPLKYGSSEIDPDPIVGLLKIRNEPYALNRHTIEVFSNIGGSLFPFARIEGTRIDKGCLATHLKCWYLGTVAFVGSGRNESPAIYLGLNAEVTKISTREIDQILQEYTESELQAAVLQPKVDKDHQHLMLFLPDKTLVYDAAASRILQTQVWFCLSSGLLACEKYQGLNHCWCYDRWNVADDQGNIGYLTDSVSSQWGEQIGWEIYTPMIHNASRGAIIHELELVALPGRAAIGDNPSIWASYSLDGEYFSTERQVYAGTTGNRRKRLVWRRNGHMRNYRVQKFRGTSESHLSLIRLEAQIEPLVF